MSRLTYWRAKNGQEVDFIIGEEVAIEVKSSKKVNSDDHKGLLAIIEEKSWNHTIVVSRDPQHKSFQSGIINIYWEDFLTRLWKNEFL